LELPENSQVHPVFHVSQLRAFTTDYTPVCQDLPKAPPLDLTDLQPERILQRRLSKKGNSDITQILVHWSSLLVEMVTWEDYHVLKAWFPDASVWGQLESQGGGIVVAGVSDSNTNPAQDS
jgi:hypothetical protein